MRKTILLLTTFTIILSAINLSYASCTIVVRDNTSNNEFNSSNFVRAESSYIGLLIIPKCLDNSTSTKENCSSGLYGTPSRLLFTYLNDFKDCKAAVDSEIKLTIEKT